MKIKICLDLHSLHMIDDEDIEGNAKYWARTTKMCELAGVKYELIPPDDLGLIRFCLPEQEFSLPEFEMNHFMYNVLGLFAYEILFMGLKGDKQVNFNVFPYTEDDEENEF